MTYRTIKGEPLTDEEIEANYVEADMIQAVFTYTYTKYIYGLFSMAITGLIGRIKLQFIRTTRV